MPRRLFSPDRYEAAPQPYVTALVALLLGLGLLCLGAHLLYVTHSPLLESVFTNRGFFWLRRLSTREVEQALLSSAVTLVGLAALLVGLRSPAFVRALMGLRASLQRAPRRAAGVFYVTGAALAVGYAVLRFWTNEELEFATLSMLTQGEAYAPFQQRTLIPWIVGLVTEVVPGLLPSERLLYQAIEAASCFVLILAFSRYLSLFVENRTTCRLLALTIGYPLLFTLATSYRANAFLFPYDTPSILVMTLGLVLLYRRQWGLYYLLFLVGTVNRETTCFLTMIYVFTALKEEPLKRIALHGAAQFVLWVAVKYALLQLYIDQPLPRGGQGAFEDQSALNNLFLSDPLSYLYFFQVLGGLWVPVLALGWTLRQDFARRSLLVGVPFVLGMYVVGYLAELRVFGELIPLVLLAFWLLVRRLAQLTLAAASPTKAALPHPAAK